MKFSSECESVALTLSGVKNRSTVQRELCPSDCALISVWLQVHLNQ